MSNNIAEEITQGDNTPKVKFAAAVKNFLYAITFSANVLVMVLRLIFYFAILTGVVLTIIASVYSGSAYVFFDGFVTYILIGVGLFALTEIINRKRNK